MSNDIFINQAIRVEGPIKPHICEATFKERLQFATEFVDNPVEFSDNVLFNKYFTMIISFNYSITMTVIQYEEYKYCSAIFKCDSKYETK